MSGSKILWLQVITVFGIVIAAIWGATEWTAWQLNFQPELGAPWWVPLRLPVYLPPAFFWWWFAYGHLMVSCQETARPLLTPGEIMQLPPDDEIVMISGTYPIRAKKARYFEDHRLAERVLPPPKPGATAATADQKPDDWTKLPLPEKPAVSPATTESAAGTGDGKTTPEDKDDPANAGIRREPELPEHEKIEPSKPAQVSELAFGDDGEEPDDETVRLAELRRQMGGLARQASLDPADDLGL